MERRQLLINWSLLLLGVAAVGVGLWLFQRSLVRTEKDAKAGRGFAFTVRTAPVERGDLNPTLQLQGDVVARKASTIRAEVAGLVAALPAREGQQVKESDLLAQIQEKDFQLEVQRRQAQGLQSLSNVKRQETALTQAKDLLGRLETLWKDKLVSEEQVTGARLAVQSAQAALAEARAQAGLRHVEVLAARRDVERSRILAPFAGRVARRFVEVGDRVAAGSPVVELVGGQGVELHLYLPVSQVNRIAPGTAVRFRPAGRGGAWHEASIGRVLPTADPASRNQTVVVPLVTPPEGVAPGLAVEAQVPIGLIRGALLLGADALTRNGNQWVVFRVAAGKAQRVAVTLLGESGAQVAVSGPLKEGDPVVVMGNETLFPNAPVRVVGSGSLADRQAPPRGRAP